MNPFYKYRNILSEYIDLRSIPVLYKNWTDKYRKYHGISHLEDVLAYIERWSYRFTKDEFDQLILASFFHDAVYGVKDAEDQSLKFFRKASLNKNKKYSITEKAIESTKYRNKPIEFPIKIFWEADNQIFKKNWKDYQLWESEIREEYSHVADDIYIKHRIKFLNENLGKFGAKADSYIKKLIKQIGDK